MTYDTTDLDGLLDRYERYLRSWNASDSTVRQRRCVLRRAVCEIGAALDEMTTEQLGDWLANPSWAPWTRCNYHGHLRSFFGWLFDSGQIPTDPAARLRAPKTPRDAPRPLTPAERDLVLASAKGNLRTWLLLGLLAGLRAHEVAKIRGEDVTEDAIFVFGKGRREALLPTHPDLWGLARSYPRSGWWFPGRHDAASHVHPTSVSGLVSRHFQALGVEGSFHRCRHTYATQLLRNGANIRVVQTLMRHESLATTAKYTAVDESERALAVRGLVAL